MSVELTVWAHDPADPQIYVDPSLIGNAKEGDVAEMWQPSTVFNRESMPSIPDMEGLPSRQENGQRASSDPIGSRKLTQKVERKNIYFQIAKPKSSMSSGKPSLPFISVDSQTLNTLGIRPRSQVRVRVLRGKERLGKVYLDVVEIHFKGVNLTRNDHYKIGKSISGKCVHCGQKIDYLNSSVRVTIDTLFRNGKRKFSGFIGDDTRLVFRSDSARILIFIQMSSEMWNFDESGDIMFHRLVNSFIPEMLHRWHTQGDSHLVSIILFTSVSPRVHNAKSDQILGAGMLEQESFHFYRVVADNVHISRWSDIMSTLRSEFERFPREVLEDPNTHELLGYFLPSSKSNILEAFSLATTLLTNKFVDRDLCRTGVQAMVVTAGPACFDVDLSELWQLSKRLLGVEIGIELVCLARPPLHVTPLFRALLPATENDSAGKDDFLGIGKWTRPAQSRLVFCVPTWINMSFWFSSDKYLKQWVPRCRIYDLQMVGLIENEARGLGLKSFKFNAAQLSHSFMRSFDSGVFKSVDMIESQKRIELIAQTANSAELRPRTELLDKAIPASAITTVAVANPVIVEPAVNAADESHDQNSSLSSPLRHTVSHKSSNDLLDVSGIARLSLNALLKFGQSSSPSQSKVRKQPSSWSFSRKLLGKTPSEAAMNSSISQQSPPPFSESPSIAVMDSGVTEDEPIYIKTPAQKVNRKHLRRESRTRLQTESPTSRWSTSGVSPRSPSKKLHSRRYSVTGSDFDRKYAGAISPPSVGTGGFLSNWNSGAKSMCDTSRPELQNPAMWRVLPNSAIIDNPSRVTAYGRWANVYPPNRRFNGVSWHSLKSPASLPLTSESFPSLVAFREQYNFQFYDVTIDSDEISLSLLLDEMIGLRLQLGFQIAVGSSVRAVEASFSRGNPNRVAPIVPSETRDCIGIRIYMTRMGLIHRLAVDDDNTVNVRLYTAIDRNARWLKSPFNGNRREDVKVKSRHDSEYKNINKQFLDQGLEHLNWSMLDQQVSGSDDPLLYPSSANIQNLVTIRYVLLPIDAAVVPGYDTLTAEESHVEGITKIVRQLLRNREAGSIDSDFIVHYYTGKLCQSIGEIVQDSSSTLELNRLNKLISLEDLASEMQGAMGLTFRDRRWHWKQFSKVFTGHDFVIWLMKTFEDIHSNEEAEAFGVDVMRRGLIRHPENRHPFIQGHYFYELTPQYAQGATSTNVAEAEPKSADELVNSDGNRKDNSISSDGASPNIGNSQQSQAGLSSNTQPQKVKRAKVHISESFVINVDPRGISGRPERVKVSIDRMHNPKNAFHILVEWLSVTPRLVDDLFTSAGRIGSQYGLRLVQVPVADVSGSLEESPFRSAMKIMPKIELSDSQESRWFRHYLLRRCGYVLDIHDRRDVDSDEYEVEFFWGRLRSSLSQYIHSSGYVLVQVEDDGQLCVTTNTLHLSRAVLAGNSAASNVDTECEKLMKELWDLCSDSDRLQVMLEDGRNHRKQFRPVTSVSVLHSSDP